MQPYAFTTKSLYVGHTDYKYLRWQVIDTPGILDHPLEDRNVIEMQAITALAHLRACVLYVMDISEQCGHTLEEQLQLYESIRPLFANKPLMIVLNKIDVIKLNELDANRQEILSRIMNNQEVPVLQMSTVSEEGVMEVKTEACERLLGYRVDQKLRTKKVDNILNRLHVAIPEKRDDKERPPVIPEGFLTRRKLTRKLEKDIEEEMGDDYTLDLKKNYIGIPEEHKHDIIPEFVDGHNVADYIDPEIFEKLEQLEIEEGLRMEAGFYEPPQLNIDETLQEIRDMAKQIRHKRFVLRDNKRLAPKSDRPKIPRHKLPHVRARKAEKLKDTMEELGVDMSQMENSNFNKSKVSLKRSMVKSLPIKPKKDKESTAIVKKTGLPIKRKTPQHELGLNRTVSEENFIKFSILITFSSFTVETQSSGVG